MIMKAIHVNSTAPFFYKSPEKAYSIENFTLYNTVISALQWRKVNGEIYMVTDSIGADYYRKIGLEKVWDGIYELIPDNIEGINPEMFWAAGKLIALRDFPEKAALIDEDFIVWNKLSLPENMVTVAHREYISPDIYPDPDLFNVPNFPILERLDKSVLPCNTAFLYIPDDAFKELYTNLSISFMKSAECCEDRLCRMVFAEQRLLGMLCAYSGIEVNALLDKDRLFVAQDNFTHLWGAKQAMRDNGEYKEEFLNRCRKRIETDFPEYRYVIEAIDRNA